MLSLACSAARPTMAGYVEAWVLPRYPLLVWNEQVSLDNTPPLEAAQDLMGGPLAGNYAHMTNILFLLNNLFCLIGLFRGVGAYAIYRLVQSMTKSSLLIASRYLLPTMDPRDDPDIEWKMTGRTSHFVYEHTGLDSRGQSRYLCSNNGKLFVKFWYLVQNSAYSSDVCNGHCLFLPRFSHQLSIQDVVHTHDPPEGFSSTSGL